MIKEKKIQRVNDLLKKHGYCIMSCNRLYNDIFLDFLNAIMDELGILKEKHGKTNKKKVYCKDCKCFIEKDGEGKTINICEAPENIEIKDCWLGPKIVQFIMKPSERNKNCNCNLYCVNKLHDLVESMGIVKNSLSATCRKSKRDY